MTQSMLSSFADKHISLDEHNQQSGFRRWNSLIYDWEVEYQDYIRPDENWHDAPEGYVETHVIVEITEALVTARDKKYKKVKRPGYKLTVTQNRLLPGDEQEWESYTTLEEEYQKDKLNNCFSAFQRELLNIQIWIAVAESRAKLLPTNSETFECPFCGWATNTTSHDISCIGCGKRFWDSELFKPHIQ
ncbi:MAG: hypothetical protein R6U52_01400 [Kosmotogaceae bacterium]